MTCRTLGREPLRPGLWARQAAAGQGPLCSPLRLLALVAVVLRSLMGHPFAALRIMTHLVVGETGSLRAYQDLYLILKVVWALASTLELY